MFHPRADARLVAVLGSHRFIDHAVSLGTLVREVFGTGRLASDQLPLAGVGRVAVHAPLLSYEDVIRVADLKTRRARSVRAKVEHPIRVIKCQFGLTKVRYRGLAKNTAQLITLFALGNLWVARR